MSDLGSILEQLSSLDWTPLLLALLLGGVIGLDRELHGRPAGLRTHMLVCLVATALIVASRHLETVPRGAGTSVVFDPQRLAAGIVTGIGFLGAGAIVRSGDIVRGVTTGASIWCVAGLGVILGEGAYGLAIAVTVAALFVLVVLDRLPDRFGKVVYRRLRVRARVEDVEALVARVSGVLAQHRMRVQEISGHLEGGDTQGYELTFHLRCRDPLRAPRILETVADFPGVASVDWMAMRG